MLDPSKTPAQYHIMNWNPDLSSTYEEQEPKTRTRRGGQSRSDRVARQNREEGKQFPVLVGEVGALRSALGQRPHPVPREVGLQTSEASLMPCEKGTAYVMHGYSSNVEECSENLEVSAEDQSAFSLHATQPVQAGENGLAFQTENSAPPTVCILDLGCTRAIGSRKAVEAFCRYVDSHPDSGSSNKFEILLCKFPRTQVY